MELWSEYLELAQEAEQLYGHLLRQNSHSWSQLEDIIALIRGELLTAKADKLLD